MTGYRATFYPQAWINDYAVDVDPEGEQEWEPADQEACAAIVAEERAAGNSWKMSVLDRDDVLQEDANAPEWVKRWRGPFSIMVDEVDEEEDEEEDEEDDEDDEDEEDDDDEAYDAAGVSDRERFGSDHGIGSADDEPYFPD